MAKQRSEAADPTKVPQPASIPPRPEAVAKLTLKRQGVSVNDLRLMAQLAMQDWPWRQIKGRFLDVDDAALERVKDRVYHMAANGGR